MSERQMWITACGLWFLSSGLMFVTTIRAGDLVGTLANIAFLAGIVIFVIPLVRKQ